MRFAALIAVSIFGASAPALADAPIATGGDAQAVPPRSDTPAPPLRDQASVGDEGFTDVAIGPCGPARVGPDGKLDASPRGAIEVGVGTHGYRHIAGVICKPVGDAAITISAGETEYGGRGARR